MLKQLTVLMFVWSVPVSTLRENALEQRICRQLQKSSSMVHFSLLISFCCSSVPAGAGQHQAAPWRSQDRAPWPCIVVHSPSCHIKWFFIPNFIRKGGRLGALHWKCQCSAEIPLQLSHVEGRNLSGAVLGCLCAVRLLEGGCCCSGCAAAHLQPQPGGSCSGSNTPSSPGKNKNEL